MDAYLHYDLLQRKHRALALKAIIQEHIKPGMRVLDAGCGSGILSLWAAQTGAEVVGVDMADTTLADLLVNENGLSERVRIVRGDLFQVDLGPRPFDALLAMVYLNDPRRDEDRPQLIHRLKRFLAPGALMVPDRVRYTVTALDWPAQRSPDRWARVGGGITELEEAYGIRLRTFEKLLHQRPNKSVFPTRQPDGMIDLAGATSLSPETEVAVMDLASDPVPLPPEIPMTMTARGEFNVLLWEQELLFRGLSIFRNRSIGWVDPPMPVGPGQRMHVGLDERWRRDNLLSAL